MDAAKTFEDLVVWQKAHAMVLEIYRLTANFPASERYGLTSQLRRAAVSVPANVAEGFSRRSVNEKLRFFNISQASLEEVRYYLILGRDLDYGDPAHIQANLDHVARLLGSYIRTIQYRNDDDRKRRD